MEEHQKRNRKLCIQRLSHTLTDMKIPIPFLTALLALLPFPLFADQRHTPAPAFESTFTWLSDLDEAIEQSQKTGKPILAEFR